MANAQFQLKLGKPSVVCSFGSISDLQNADPAAVLECCDITEVRLDLLAAEGADICARPWRHLTGVPILFTVRRIEEGGGIELDAAARMAMLMRVLDDSALIDIEVASITEMSQLIDALARREIPWVASYHDFKKLPPPATLQHAAVKAAKAGAVGFKVAARLHTPQDLAQLADFQRVDHPIPVATMGMGPLAPVSRLLCAQCGSVLNYGYYGSTPTAPGQWDSALLKLAISRLMPLETII